MYKYIHTCIYIHISCAHTYTHTHIYTHDTKCTYARTQSTSETTAQQRLRRQPNLTPRSSALLPVRITTAHRPDHIHSSALVKIHPVQCPRHGQLGHGFPKRGHYETYMAHIYETYGHTSHISEQIHHTYIHVWIIYLGVYSATYPYVGFRPFTRLVLSLPYAAAGPCGNSQ